MKFSNKSQKVTAKELQFILDCSYSTAKRKYKIFLSLLDEKRNYLNIGDLINLNVLYEN